MNIKAIVMNIGRALLVSALFMFLSVLVSIYYGFDDAFFPLVISCIITSIVGAFPFIFVRTAEPLTTLRGGYVTIVASWSLSFVFGMLPYVLYGGEFTLANAWFESVSGYTTTGASILNDIEALPKSLLFWRSSTHFIGGLGVVVFLLLVIPSASPYKSRLTNLEISSLSREGYRYRSSQTVTVIVMVYVILNILAFVCYMLCGMTLFEAINHAFSVAATGGFSTKNGSIGAFDSVGVDIVTMIFMILASLHFGLIYSTVASGRFRTLLTPAFKYFMGFLAVAVVLVFISLNVHPAEGSTVGSRFLESAFTVVSYATTSGLGISDNTHWPAVACILLMLASLQCGCAGSTTGGIKADRVVLAYKAAIVQIRRMANPNSVSQIKYGKEPVEDSRIQNVLVFIFVYIALLFVSILCLYAMGLDSVEAISGSICSLGNVGSALGAISLGGNYSSLPNAAKLLMSFNMFLGRIEIYPFLVVLGLIFSGSRKK
ncbi:MAG: TrkH family potassium uptake protein [Bacteroidales bacterium]|nr:TrkH family potassium uptake protein [Bacteroidales bacterium]